MIRAGHLYYHPKHNHQDRPPSSTTEGQHHSKYNKEVVEAWGKFELQKNINQIQYFFPRWITNSRRPIGAVPGSFHSPSSNFFSAFSPGFLHILELCRSILSIWHLFVIEYYAGEFMQTFASGQIWVETPLFLYACVRWQTFVYGSINLTI